MLIFLDYCCYSFYIYMVSKQLPIPVYNNYVRALSKTILLRCLLSQFSDHLFYQFAFFTYSILNHHSAICYNCIYRPICRYSSLVARTFNTLTFQNSIHDMQLNV